MNNKYFKLMEIIIKIIFHNKIIIHKIRIKLTLINNKIILININKI